MDCVSSPPLSAALSSSSSVSFVDVTSSHGRSNSNICPRKQNPFEHCCLYHQRSRFALFVKILLKRLRESSSFEDRVLYQQAQVIVSRYSRAATQQRQQQLQQEKLAARRSNNNNKCHTNRKGIHHKNERDGRATNNNHNNAVPTTPLAEKDVFHPANCPIVDAVEVPLRELVGEHHWIRTHSYMRYYIATSAR